MNQLKDGRAFARVRGVVLAASLAAGFAPAAWGTDYIWTRGGGNNNWDNAANWTPGAPPVTPPAADTTNIVYSGTSVAATTTSAMRQSYTIDSLKFASDFVHTVGSTSTFNVSTQSTLLAGATSADLTIGAGGITSDVTNFNLTITKNAAVADADLVLAADQTWATNAPAASSGAITFTVARQIVGTSRITKTGTGVLVLSMTAANTDWSGGIDLVQGSIRTGGLTTAHNGHFGTGSISSTSANDVTITASTVNSNGGDRTFDNDLVLGGTGRLTLGGSFNINFTASSEWQLIGQKNLGITFTTVHDGTVTGEAGLNKVGGGMLILNGSNTYLGPTNVNEGVLHVRNSNGLGSGGAVSVFGAGGLVGAALELSNNVTISGHTLALAGTGVISPTSPGGIDNNAGALRNRSGNNTWTGLVTVTAPDTYVAVDAGELNLSGGIDGPGSMRVAGAGMLRTGFVRTAGLQIDGSTKVQINANGTAAGHSTLTTLNLAGGAAAPTATLDLTNNALVLDYDSTSPAADVRSLIIAGRASGAWTGPGITSSTAAGNSRGAVGYAEASSLSGTPAIFGTADASAVLVRYTLNGDANLSGNVEFDDLVRLAQNYGASGTGKTWVQGDFNYDGTVEFADLVLLAQNYNKSAFTSGQFDQLVDIGGEAFANAFVGALATVPEPGSLLSGLAFAALLRRRPRR